MKKSPVSLWCAASHVSSLYSSLIFADKRPRSRFHTCFCSEILVLGSVRPVILTLFVRSGLWFLSVPAPVFGCFVFKICDFIPTLEWCFMYPKSQIHTLLNMSSVSGKLMSLITNKDANSSFFGYRGYLALGNIFLSCMYPKDLYSRSHKVMSNSVFILNLERFLQAVMEEWQMDDKSTSGEGCSWSGKAI